MICLSRVPAVAVAVAVARNGADTVEAGRPGQLRRRARPHHPRHRLAAHGHVPAQPHPHLARRLHHAVRRPDPPRAPLHRRAEGGVRPRSRQARREGRHHHVGRRRRRRRRQEEAGRAQPRLLPLAAAPAPHRRARLAEQGDAPAHQPQLLPGRPHPHQPQGGGHGRRHRQGPGPRQRPRVPDPHPLVDADRRARHLHQLDAVVPPGRAVAALPHPPDPAHPRQVPVAADLLRPVGPGRQDQEPRSADRRRRGQVLKQPGRAVQQSRETHPRHGECFPFFFFPFY